MRPIAPEHYYRNFLHPKFWGAWLLLGTLWFISLLPYRTKLRLGRRLGLILYGMRGSRYKTARGNIRACFPELSPHEQEEMIRKSFISNAVGYMESTIAWWGNFEVFFDRIEVHGKEHLDEAFARGKGVLLLGGHFSIMDFAGPLVNNTTPFNYMYRPQNNKLLNAFIERARRRYTNVGFTKRQLRDMNKFIADGNLVWYAPDQDVGLKQGVFAPLFGVPAASLTTPAWIARETGATVLHLSQFRESEGVYSLYFSPIIEDFPTGNDVENATRINQELEKAINIHPEQYLWLHRRFKTRPQGEPSLYD